MSTAAAALGFERPGGLPRCLGRLPRRERRKPRPRDERPPRRTHPGDARRGGHQSRAASRLPSAQRVGRASAIAPPRWRGRPRAAGRRRACMGWRAACLLCSLRTRRPAAAAWRLVTTRTSSARRCSGRPAHRRRQRGQRAQHRGRIPTRRCRRSALAQQLLRGQCASAATARTTAAALPEGAQPLETAARKAPGREEGPLAAAVAGGVTTMAASTPRSK